MTTLFCFVMWWLRKTFVHCRIQLFTILLLSTDNSLFTIFLSPFPIFPISFCQNSFVHAFKLSTPEIVFKIITFPWKSHHFTLELFYILIAWVNISFKDYYFSRKIFSYCGISYYMKTWRFHERFVRSVEL